MDPGLICRIPETVGILTGRKPTLADPEEKNWKEVRHHYFETLLQMFIDRWAKPIHDYCEQKGLIWTGHYWEHKWPDLSSGPDNMAMYAWHQMPAVDMLFNQFDEVSPTAQFGNVRAIKELRSVANQMGRERTLSETYGGGGWDVTFEDSETPGRLGVCIMSQFHESAPVTHDADGGTEI